jgi:hypothetical protein
LNHTFIFWLALQEFIFFTCGPPLLTQLPNFLQKSHLPRSSTYVMNYFFKALFFLAIIITTATMPSPVAIIDV